MAIGLTSGIFGSLSPDPIFLLSAVALDFAIGDPVYAFHPIRLIGATLTYVENVLRRFGADGYGGGVALFVVLALFWIGLLVAVTAICASLSPFLAALFHLFVLYSLLALGDLIAHVRRVERALLAGDITAARAAIAMLVGRDTANMDEAACRRAAIESLSENLTDAFIAPVFWYSLLGLPGIVLFKIVSTMDSMVGNKTPRYLRFGWCGARLDDAMNYIPARLSLPLIAFGAFFVPGSSAAKAWKIAFTQNTVLPSPNSGWSEAATAGAIQRRLVGPIFMRGALVTDLWLGDPSDPPASSHADVTRAVAIVVLSGILAALLSAGAIFIFRS